MTWLRARARVVAIVALLAMMLQIACTFGHVHLANATGSPVLVKSVVVADQAVVLNALTASDAVAGADIGSPPFGADGDALCALCLVGHLVASAVLSPASTFAMPVAYARPAPWRVASAPDLAPAPTSFWCRGPPIS